MLQKTKAIVLNSLKYGDSGLIVHCFTRDYGLKSYYLPGILSSKKSKFKRSFFQPLNQLEIVGYHNNKGQLNKISDLTLMYHYQEIQTDITKQSMTMFLSEILSQTLKEELTDEKLFDFLVDSFIRLDMENKITNFHLCFLVQLIKHLGFFPVIDEKKDFFDLVEGKFTSNPQSSIFIKDTELQCFVEVLKCNYDSLNELNLSYKQRNDILEIIFQYMSLHIHSFKKPKSIVVLKELFH